jgi:predicted amidophosphoribosyltransferase
MGDHVSEGNRNFKRCPDCEETVPHDAGLCRHCGYVFETRVSEPVTTSELAKRAVNQQGLFVKLLTLGTGVKRYPPLIL